MGVRSTSSALGTVPEGPGRGLDALLTEAVATAKVERALYGAVVCVQAHAALQHVRVHHH